MYIYYSVLHRLKSDTGGKLGGGGGWGVCVCGGGGVQGARPGTAIKAQHGGLAKKAKNVSFFIDDSQVSLLMQIFFYDIHSENAYQGICTTGRNLYL